MKIVSISTIKNESDIIESFIRYHARIFDLMIILDNGSTDDTNYILDELKKEGLPIVVLIDKDKYFEPQEKYNFLLKKSFEEYGADIVCPLDADEFIASKNSNPRELIEKIPSKSYYTAMWKTYIPTEDDDVDDLFVPSRIKHVRDVNIESQGKVIVTKELFNDYGASLDIGNHFLFFDEKYKDEITNIIDNGLNIAHFPLRSVFHTMTKVLTNYPNSRARKVVVPGASYHYVIMFNKIKETGTIDMKDVTEFAKQYSLIHNKGRDDFDRSVEIEIYEDPMNLNFCKDIEIKYPFKENLLSILLENTLYFANEIHNFKNMDIQKKEDKSKKSSSKKNQSANVSKSNGSSKSSFVERLLNKSNSYVYYKNNYEKLIKNNRSLIKQKNELIENNNQLNDDLTELKNENLKLNKDNHHSKLQKDIYHIEASRLNSELGYIFDETCRDDLDEIGLLVKLLKYKHNLDEFYDECIDLNKNDRARIDIKNFGNEFNTVEILNCSDENSSISFPPWYIDDQGKGAVIESNAGKLDLKIKNVRDGKFKIFLRSIDLRDENEDRIELFIDYTSLRINGVDYLNNSGLYSHDSPFIVEMNIEDSQILNIHVEWVTYDRIGHNENIVKKDIYQEIRQELLLLNADAEMLKKLPIELYGLYINVLNNETYEQYVNFNNSLKGNDNFINKKEKQAEIDNFTEIGLNNEERENSIIVSLTSFPDRMNDVHFCLYSLLKQNFKPDKVILWLAREQFPNGESDLSKDVLKLKDNGLTIKWCEDIKSYKKLIPILKECPDDFIVTVDDDVYYHEDWLEKIWNTYLENPGTIISSRPRILSKDEDNEIMPYNTWQLSEGFEESSFLNFPTGAGGTMYFPHALPDKVLDKDTFMRLCPSADDIWFWAMAILNNTKITGIDKPYKTLTYVNIVRERNIIKNNTLWKINQGGRNDEQIENVFNEFPIILKRINKV